MGAVTFSLDQRFLECLKGALPLTTFVETGTFKGDAVAIAAPYVERVVTVEFSRPLWEEAVKRFSGDARVEALLGNSPEVLARIRPTLGDTSTLFWLDAHWCVADNTAGDHSQCPLLAEISAIGTLGETSVILIDDARLFLAPPPQPYDVAQWPTFDEVVRALRSLSGGHELMVVNDVIACYPASARDAVSEHAHRHGIDWLRATQSLEENTALRISLEDKESVIRELESATKSARASALAAESARAEFGRIVKEKDLMIAGLQYSARHAQPAAAITDGSTPAPAVTMKILEEKEAVIRQLRTAVDAYRATFAVLGIFIVPFNHLVLGVRSVLRRSLKLIAPRLGILNQHEPIRLSLPAHYALERPPAPPPRISIVTPSFRQAAFIERTIASVLGQDYPDLEFVVQDGASQDGTREILQRYSERIASWESRRDEGQTQAINRGFARTSGEIMAWLNSDDILLPGTLAYVANFFNAHPQVDVVYGHRILIDEKDRQIGRWILPEHNDEVLSWADYVPQETLFWRRRIWDKAGGCVDESFRFAMDWDLLVRFRDSGAKFARLPRFLGGFRIHPHQKTSAAIAGVGFEEMNRIRERILGRVPSTLEVRKAVLPYLVKHVASDMAWRVRRRCGVAT
jgi:glycosyltransferase involved in cell wall biosynthesis